MSTNRTKRYERVDFNETGSSSPLTTCLTTRRSRPIQGQRCHRCGAALPEGSTTAAYQSATPYAWRDQLDHAVSAINREPWRLDDQSPCRRGTDGAAAKTTPRKRPQNINIPSMPRTSILYARVRSALTLVLLAKVKMMYRVPRSTKMALSPAPIMQSAVRMGKIIAEKSLFKYLPSMYSPLGPSCVNIRA